MLKTRSILVNECARALRPGAVENIRRSVTAIGLGNPIAVTRCAGYRNKYRIAAGHQRFQACKAAGLSKVPCVIVPRGRVARRWAIAENLHRAEPTKLELAELQVDWATELARDLPKLASGLGRPVGERSRVAGAMGRGKSASAEIKSLERAQKIAGLPRATKAALAKTVDLANNQRFLLLLTEKSKKEQLELIEARSSRRRPRSATSVASRTVINTKLLAKLTVRFQKLTVFNRIWKRADKATRESFIKRLRVIH